VAGCHECGDEPSGSGAADLEQKGQEMLFVVSVDSLHRIFAT
jgi:hypothetical protein